MVISLHPVFTPPPPLHGFASTCPPPCSPIPPQQTKLAPVVHAQASPLLSSHQDPEYVCNICKARGWLICEFCNGQKTNIQVKNNKMYRRCPACKAAGVVICPECIVYKCVTFPDGKDGVYEM